MRKKSLLVFVAMSLLVFSVLLYAKGTQRSKRLAGYGVVVVEPFTVEQNAATEEFPKGQEMLLQQSAVARLQKKGVFEEILDGTDNSAKEVIQARMAEGKKCLLLSGTVIQYDKGSRAGRWLVGFGAGATKVKVRFVFHDAETGEELLQTDRRGKFYGTFSIFGGGKGHAVSEAAGDVVDGLIKVVKKNR
jgi:hypothetical protein